MGTQQPRRLLDPSLAASQQSLSSALEAATPSPLENRLQLLRHFDAVFSESPVSTAADAEEAFRLRYLVYCLDRGFEDAKACPDGMERDPYDDAALHCLLRDRVGRRALGTVRLVIASAAKPLGIDSLPLAEYADPECIDILKGLPVTSTAEVSRFAIARSAREILSHPQEVSRTKFRVPAPDAQHGSKLLPYMSLGLIRGLVRLSMQHGITHWCLAAEPSLLRRLRGFGLHFVNAGPLVEHRGLRQICYANLHDLLARAEAEHPEFWDIITVGGFLLSDALARTAA
jgi:N-acyl amino acid synthase of PEP-CTERM/exosortase system